MSAAQVLASFWVTQINIRAAETVSRNAFLSLQSLISQRRLSEGTSKPFENGQGSACSPADTGALTPRCQQPPRAQAFGAALSPPQQRAVGETLPPCYRRSIFSLCSAIHSPPSPHIHPGGLWQITKGKEKGVVFLSPGEQRSLKPAELVIKMWEGHDQAQKMEEWDTGSRKMLSTRLRATRHFELKINEKIAYRERNAGGEAAVEREDDWGGVLFEHCPQTNLVRRSSDERLQGVVRQRKVVQLFHGVTTPAEPWKTKCLPGQKTGLRARSSHSISNLKMETRNIKVTFPPGTCFLPSLTSSTTTAASIRDTDEMATEGPWHTRGQGHPTVIGKVAAV